MDNAKLYRIILFESDSLLHHDVYILQSNTMLFSNGSLYTRFGYDTKVCKKHFD